MKAVANPMRRFSSYGPIDTDTNFYVPRAALIDRGLRNLLGEEPSRQGGYVTMWAPRQAGKSWIKGQILRRLEAQHPQFDVLSLNVEHLKAERDALVVVREIAAEVTSALSLPAATIDKPGDLQAVFARDRLAKPLVLLIDEFDALAESAIEAVVGVFRNIYIRLREQSDRPTGEKDLLLHGVLLVGVRSVLGIENVSGSPFNVQRSLHIPNLTFEEVRSMFAWYEDESGQAVEADVVRRLYDETLGQPGLISWLGELLTETGRGRLNPDGDEREAPATLTMRDFEQMYAKAVNTLPNANIMNLIAKVREAPYRDLVLAMFETERKLPLRIDEPRTGFLYMNGVVSEEETSDGKQWLRFACPFVQRRLFNYFSFTNYDDMGRLFAPLEDISDTVTETSLNIRRLLERFERHLRANRDWLLKDAPRRSDMRVREAVFHFILYSYLTSYLQHWRASVQPEFPTGNGKIDLLIDHAGQTYGIEVKTYSSVAAYRDALRQAAGYGQQLGLKEIALVFFVDAIDDANRERFQAPWADAEAGVTVVPTLVVTG